MDKQYKCYSCGARFSSPSYNFWAGERSEGIAEPDDYENICPNCASTDFELVNTCDGCGVEIEVDEEYCINCLSEEG